ncbi:MAG: hypothetical protein H8E36_16785 [Rhodospirillaceae bacterium]|nr:hypothetical protein [Rhodospirillaceae bacterium]
MKKVANVLRGFLPVFQTPERIREVIQDDVYITAWFWQYARMVQENDLKIPVTKDFAFAKDVVAYCLELSVEEVSEKMSASSDIYDPTVSDGEPHPIFDATKTYDDVVNGKEPWGLISLKERFNGE